MPSSSELHTAFFQMKTPTRDPNESRQQWEQKVRDALQAQIIHNREQAQKGNLTDIFCEITCYYTPRIVPILTIIFLEAEKNNGS